MKLSAVADLCFETEQNVAERKWTRNWDEVYKCSTYCLLMLLSCISSFIPVHTLDSFALVIDKQLRDTLINKEDQLQQHSFFAINFITSSTDDRENIQKSFSRKGNKDL